MQLADEAAPTRPTPACALMRERRPATPRQRSIAPCANHCGTRSITPPPGWTLQGVPAFRSRGALGASGMACTSAVAPRLGAASHHVAPQALRVGSGEAGGAVRSAIGGWGGGGTASGAVERALRRPTGPTPLTLRQCALRDRPPRTRAAADWDEGAGLGWRAGGPARGE